MPTASDRSARRRELLDAADRAIRRDGPTVSMAAIATEAGITKPILYRHFGDKGGLYEALARRYVDDAATVIEEALEAEREPRARIRVTVDAYLALLEEQPETYRFLLHRAIGERAEARAALEDFTHQLAERLAVVLRDELDRAGLDSSGAATIAHALIGMVQHAGEWWLAGAPVEREELVEDLVRFAWRGVSGLPSSGPAP